MFDFYNIIILIDKGALKKQVVKESKDLNSFGRSTLKVRWKDMIEISNVVHFVNDDNGKVTRTTKSNVKTESSSSSVDTSSSTTAKQLSSVKLNDSGEEINDIYGDRDVEDDEQKEEEEEDDEDEDDDDDDDEDSEDTEDSSEMSVEEEKNRVSSHLVQTATKPSRVERLIISEKRTAPNGQSVTMNVSKTSEHLLLEPLHATGREFEKEMNDRIEKLNRIKVSKSASYFFAQFVLIF